VIHRHNTFPQRRTEGRFKIHVEVGWGEEEGATEWDVELRLEETGTRAGGRRARAMGGGRVVPEDRIEIGQEGNVRVRDLDPGRFDVTVLPWGYAEIQREGVRLKAGETSDLGILRVREGNFVSGRVVDPEGSPVGSARVFALWMDGDRPRTRVVTARADGTWKLAGLGEAPLRQLRAFARGYSAEEKSGALPGDRNVDFVLEPAGVVLGRVIRPDGTAPPAFRVKVHEEAGSRPETGFMRRLSFAGDGEEVFADPTGNFRLDTVEPGTVTLEATAEGWAPARKTGVQVASGVETEAGTLVLDPGRTLRGRILDARDDVPLPGAVVTVLTAQGPMRFRFGASSEPTAISDMGGVFRLSGLESRAYTAIVDHSDYAPYQTQVEIPEDEDPPELVVRLGRGGVLTGTVRDASKQPVEGANLIAMLGMMEGDLREAATGPDGVYRFEGLAPGTYRVMRTPSGDRLVVGLGMKQAIVREGETTVLDFDEIAPITLRGTVLRGGNPVPGATLVFAQGTGAFPMGDVKSASSGADGRYEVGLEASGAYTVIVQSEGLSRRGSSVEILVPEGPQPVVDIVLRVGSISGRVVNESAEPVAGAIVSARRGDDGAPGGFGSGVGTRPDGTFTLDSLEDGAYRITASAAGYETGEAGPILVQDGTSDAEVEIRLETGRTIRGVVLDPRGGPVQGASVAAFPSGSSDAPFLPSSTDVNGAFVLTAPSDGPIDLVAVARGYAPARASGIVPEETADGSGVVLRVSSGGRIRIRVVDGSGAPVVGARVSVSASPPYPGSSLAVFVSGNLVTGPEGSATATSLAPGSYAVVAESAGQRTQRTVSVAEGQETDVTLTTSIVR
jgi:protocatechuate 3,4-dioxygenase beta subunit